MNLERDIRDDARPPVAERAAEERPQAGDLQQAARRRARGRNALSGTPRALPAAAGGGPPRDEDLIERAVAALIAAARARRGRATR